MTQGRTATFTFSYTVENPQLLTIILCGYRSTTPDWIVSKTGLHTSVILQKYTARAQRGVDSTNQIGFSLLNVQLSDAGNIGCQMIYNGNALYSQLFRLKIYGKVFYFIIPFSLALPGSIFRCVLCSSRLFSASFLLRAFEI